MPEKEITVNGYTYQLVEKPSKSSLDFEEGEKYYYICTDGSTLGGSSYDDRYNKPYVVYKTKEEAQIEIDVKKAIYEIKKYSEEKRGLYEPDFYGRKSNYCIFYSHQGKYFYYDLRSNDDYGCFMYWNNEKHAEEIIKRFEPQLKIIFNIK